MIIPRFRLYLFDVDGTLTDSAEDICGAIEATLARRGHPPQSFEFLRSFIGRHLTEMFCECIPGVSEAEVSGLIEDYRQTYWAREHASTRLYPGVAEAMPRIPGLKSTATTKGTPTTRIVLEKFGLLPYFDHVQGTDGFPAKPAPDVIERSLQRFAVDPADVLMVGDAPADVLAARAAGIQCCAVRYGYGNPAHMEPDFWIDSLAELAG